MNKLEENNIKEITYEVPDLAYMFPKLPSTRLVEAIKEGIWIQKTPDNWIISGEKFTKEDLIYAIHNSLLHGKRLEYNLMTFCLHELPQEFKIAINKKLIKSLTSVHFFGLTKVNKNLLINLLWIIGKYRIIEAKEDIEKIVNDSTDFDIKFEALRAISRIEGNVESKAFAQLQNLKKVDNKKYEQSINYLQMELNSNTKIGNSTNVSSVKMVDKEAFISYTGQGKRIKKFVLQLGEDLLNNGIEVYLDEWDVGFGDQFTDFMNKIETVDYTLMIFTKKYCEKLVTKSGGVSYEKRIIDSLIEKGMDKKIITILKEKSAVELIPPRFSSKKYVNLSSKSNYEKNINKLVNHILGKKKKKPPLKSPP